MATRRSSKKERKAARARRVDFSGVEAGGRRRIPSGEYSFKVIEITEDEGDAGTYWRVVSEITAGKQKGFKDYTNYSFSNKALWKLRQFLEACGMPIPERKMKLDPNDLIGLEFAAGVEDDTYQGKTRSRIADVFPLEELASEDNEEEEEDDEDEEDEEDEEENPAKKKAKEEEEEDEEEDEDDDEDEEEEEEEKPSKKKRRA